MTGPVIETSVVVVLLFVLGQLLWRVRIAQGRRQLERMNAGEMCFHCDSLEVARSAEGIDCRACGQLTPRALIEGGGAIDPSEVERMTVDPNDARPWYAR